MSLDTQSLIVTPAVSAALSTNIRSLCVVRLAELTSDHEGSERVKKAKPIEVVQTSLADRFTQLQDAENSWKKKVRLSTKHSLRRRKKPEFSLSGS